MTTIVYRDGVMASDSRAWSGDKVPIGFKQKIRRLDDGSLLGISSAKVGEPDMLLDAIKRIDGKVWEKPLDAEFDAAALLVRANGDVYYYSGNKHFVGPIRGPWIVIGSGEEYAIGALSMGATAEQAVKVGIEHDPWSKGEIQTLRLKITVDPAEFHSPSPPPLTGCAFSQWGW